MTTTNAAHNMRKARQIYVCHVHTCSTYMTCVRTVHVMYGGHHISYIPSQEPLKFVYNTNVIGFTRIYRCDGTPLIAMLVVLV